LAAENKTKVTKADVSAFVSAIADAGQQADAKALIKLLARITGEKPKMWGTSIIGFGTHHYRYDSGREGDICKLGFSPRKGQTVLYLSCDLARHAKILVRLGKHKTGKGCLYVKRLSDIDTDVLEELCRAALARRG
jgi:hypothetical protein